MRDHPDEKPPCLKTTLKKDHPEERPPWWKTTLFKDYPDKTPPWWETTLFKDDPDKTPPWWETTLFKDDPDKTPPWWENHLCSRAEMLTLVPLTIDISLRWSPLPCLSQCTKAHREKVHTWAKYMLTASDISGCWFTASPICFTIVLLNSRISRRSKSRCTQISGRVRDANWGRGRKGLTIKTDIQHFAPVFCTSICWIPSSEEVKNRPLYFRSATGSDRNTSSDFKIQKL